LQLAATCHSLPTIEIDTLEEQQTEKIETEMKDVDRIRIRKVHASCPGWPSGGQKELSSQTQIYAIPADFSSPLINEDLPGQAAACIYF
jgi:hypothetical protein